MPNYVYCLHIENYVVDTNPILLENPTICAYWKTQFSLS